MRLVICSVPSERADALATDVVERGLAACVHALPQVRSTYRWEGKLVHELETPLWIKVGADRVDALVEALVAMHPYQVPEVLVVPVDTEASHRPYVDWVRTRSMG